jgi:calcyclin binding protein
MNLDSEIAETEQLITNTTFDGIKVVLQNHLTKLKKQKQAAETAAAMPPTPPVTSSSSSSSNKPVITGTFIPVEDYAWDQGAYGSSSLSIFVDIPGVGEVKDKVKVDFGRHSFDLRVMDLQGKNYRLIKDNLEKDIIPELSSFTVKKNKVVIKLQKKKGEYSYEQWTALTGKKKRDEEEASKSKDPMGG